MLGLPGSVEAASAQSPPAQISSAPEPGPGGICVSPGPHGFSDVPSNSYYNLAVGWLVEAGITSGVAPGKFAPTATVTRGQMAVFLWASAGSPQPAGGHSFTDVKPGVYYEQAVIWLVGEGITSGVAPGKFAPSAKVTRAQMAVFLWAAAGSPSVEGTHDFTDLNAGSYYEGPVTWLVGEGITSGVAPGKYGPTRPVTRAQVAVFLHASACTKAPVGTSIAAGDSSSCVLNDDQTVACWGLNAEGQLGDGTTTNRLAPTQVPGLTSTISLTAGRSHSCALKAHGTVACWGSNDSGQLGDGTTTNRLEPTLVLGLSGVLAIDAGDSHTCAVKRDAKVACWGFNYYGQLGDGTTTNRLTPTPVVGLSGVSATALGSGHSCALKDDGQVACWGGNYNGQLGDGTTTSRLTPTPVAGLTEVLTIAAGARHSCALNVEGTVACWGDNDRGQLGDGTTAESLTPTPLAGMSGMTGLALGSQHSCASKQNGGMACWGDNGFGQIGDGTWTNDRLTPATVVGLSEFSELTAGESHSCVLKIDGTKVCWGGNEFGQLGEGTTIFRLKPPVWLTGVASIATAGHQSCALKINSTVACWGSGTLGVERAAVPIDGLSGVTAITAGWSSMSQLAHFCALIDNGAVVCWGDNNWGQLGDGSQIKKWTPSLVVGLSDATAITAGESHSCALKETGTVACWGLNDGGHIGDGTYATSPRLTATSVVTLSDVRAITAGSDHTCALKATGTVACWGLNQNGQLGNGTIPDPVGVSGSGTPVSVSGLSGVTMIDAGRNQTCAVLDTGTVECWGTSGSIFGSTPVPEPVPVINLTGATSVAAGGNHSCALQGDGNPACWGWNGDGQLGDGSTNPRSVPAPVDALHGVQSIDSGIDHSCALKVDGSVACWGNNLWGQLGVGDLWGSPQWSPTLAVES